MINSVYLERYAWKERLFPEYHPKKAPEIIIVLPSFKEKSILQALDSINACKPPGCQVLIIVVVNESETASDEIKGINQETIGTLKAYESRIELKFTQTQLPYKKAGVGLARKIGMDEAVRIFEASGIDGLIVCFDADCTCQSNYLIALEDQLKNPSFKAGVVFYEHRLDGPFHDSIIKYELYLRYYIDALRFAGFPFAHQTLGSCIIVRSSIYQQSGGMNTRQAGEDFYFLNKVIPLGGFVEINDTTIFPSDRISHRVPFGTGKAVGKLESNESEYLIYHPQIFEDLKAFFDQLNQFWDSSDYSIPETMQKFLVDFGALDQLRSQVASKEAFNKRFFQWFDAFKILKYVHFARDHFYPNVPLVEALTWLASNYGFSVNAELEELLLELRSIDRRFKQSQISL